MYLKNLVLSAVIAASSLTGIASAQQPGSAAYNSRVLPAHGVGDTRREVLSWGAYAMGSNEFIGLSSHARNEGEARTNAQRNCADRGGENCRVLTVYANGCIAIAANDQESAYATGSDLAEVKSRALNLCGANCEIFRDECSFPN